MTLVIVDPDGDEPAPAPRPAPPPDVPVTPAVRPASAAWKVLGAAVLSAALGFSSGYVARGGLPPLPRPAPAPAPRPAPAPAPAPYTGPLYGLLVVPDPPDVDQSALRASKVIRQAADAAAVSWRTFLSPSAEIAPYAKTIAENGGPPVVLWVDDSGKVLRVTRAPIEPTVLADMKGLRAK